MKNKLGITNDIELKNVEYKITNFKHKLLDEKFLFNEETIFSMKYLEKLHTFLFSDIYDDNDCKIKNNISENTIKKVESELQNIKILAYDFNDIDKEKLAISVYNIWKEQIFLDGNTRTLRAFLKVYYLGFGINMEHDFNRDIHDDYFINKLVKTKQKK